MVTGAGSGVGQGIVRALRIASLPTTIIFADVDRFTSGLFRGDESVLVPRVEDEGAIEILVGLIRKLRIDAVMVGSEFDLVFFSKNRGLIERETAAKVIISPPEVIDIGLDKWLTVEFLRNSGLLHAESCIPVDLDDAIATTRAWGYPLILKGRKGRGSRETHLVRSDNDIKRAYPLVREPMLQRMIAEPGHGLNSEFTCGIVKDRDGRVLGPTTTRRTLRNGHSWVMEMDTFESLHPLLLAIGERLPILGPFNVQLMVGPNGPVPFEFNPRCSGTTPIRAHFGFNEPEISLRSFVLGEKVSNPIVRRGLAFRYFDEVFVDDILAEDLKKLDGTFPKGIVHDWF